MSAVWQLYYSCRGGAAKGGLHERHIQLQIGRREGGGAEGGGIAGPLLVQQLCFPPNLWSLQRVGRSLCDYCLRADLYLTFNYLRGVCSLLMPIHPPRLGPVGREERSTLPFSLSRYLSACGTGLKLGIYCDSGSVPAVPRAQQTDVTDINTHCGV